MCGMKDADSSTATLVLLVLTGIALALALGDDALAEPFGGEAPAKNIEVCDDVLAALDDGLFGSHRAIGLNAEFERGEEGMRDLVGGEEDVLVAEETLGEEVAESVILFVEFEDGRVGCACGG